VSRRALPAGLGLVELPVGPFSLPRGAVQSSQALATEAPARRNGFVTFGATLDLPRLLPSVETWAAILAQDPGHHLILGTTGEISQSVLARVEAAFAPYGLTERILIDLPDPSPTSGESFWTKADVILSPLEAPDPLEAAQALLMGTPVVGLAGPRLAHARTAGVLSMAGQEHWIAADRAAYVQIAASMARSPAAVAELREALRGTIDQMPLCDAATFAATFEAALVALARGG
jgi:predicted O-linked N-acetylglucosamine transferase (SPINDLY family)